MLALHKMLRSSSAPSSFEPGANVRLCLGQRRHVYVNSAGLEGTWEDLSRSAGCNGSVGLYVAAGVKNSLAN